MAQELVLSLDQKGIGGKAVKDVGSHILKTCGDLDPT